MRGFKNHPYIPNSDESIQKEMLEYIGLNSLEELHEEVPEEIKLKGPMDLEEAIPSEYELKRHMMGILKKNRDCTENLCFLGAGCWPHYVPAICDEINSRGEFLTAYGGEPYNDFGRFQSLFEYQSLVAELVDMEVVNVPTMDWSQAAATSIRMAGRMTKRKEVLVSGTVSPERISAIKNYCKADLDIIFLNYDKMTGLIDINDLQAKISENVAAVYFENPSYLGFVETQGMEISEIAKSKDVKLIVGVDPISLGVIESPRSYGADIICGDLQPLGIHMNYGGGQGGFMATRDEESYVMEYPSRLFGIAPTIKEGEYGFGDVAYDRTSFGHHREKGKEYVGTQAALWGITAGVYLATMGPKGMEEVGQNIIQKNLYAKQEISKLENVDILFNNFGFKEFIIDFNKTGKTVKEINKQLLEKNIFGGKDLSCEFEYMGQCALYCVTEIHTKSDIDYLVKSLKEITGEEC